MACRVASWPFLSQNFSRSRVASPPILGIRFQVVGLILFCGDTFKFEISKRRVGSVGGVVGGLEGILGCCGFGILWDNVDGDLFLDRIS